MFKGKRKWVLGYGAVAVALSACGPSKGGGRNETVVDPATMPKIYGTAQTRNYRLADSDCALGTGAPTLSKATFFTFLGGRVNSQTSPVTGFSGTPSLKSGGVSQTKVGMVGEQTCEGDTCNSDLKLSNPGYPLKVCKGEADYPRDSIEGISLTTMVHLNNVLAFYQGIQPGAHPALPSLDLMIMPTFVTGQGASSETKVDNLSYYPTLEKKPYVVVFPKSSQVGQVLWPHFNLWESPWVIAHEAAHHIFRTNFYSNNPVSSLASALDDSAAPIIALPKEAPYRVGGESDGSANLVANLDARRVTLADFVGAVNEGFADLFGYYSIGERKDITTDFVCFHKSRDVADPLFADGTRKAFSHDILGIFFADVEQKPRPHPEVPLCEVPHFQGIHSMGAVFAHVFDQLLSRSPRVVGAANPTLAKSHAAVEWVRRMSRLGAFEANPEGFGRILRSAVDTAALGGITPEQCGLVKDLMPVYADEWMRDSVYGPALGC